MRLRLRTRHFPTEDGLRMHIPVRCFHDYFVTHLPSSSLHPDSKSQSRPPSLHKLPRADSIPHNADGYSRTPSILPPSVSGTTKLTNPSSSSLSRETTVVRIPLRSAKHHFGATAVRGARPYNEDRYQAGTIDIPAFAKRQPVSISRRPGAGPANPSTSAVRETQGAQTHSGDPQVFYFGVFDGHGGEVCSDFLRDRLHTYIEDVAQKFRMQSSLVQQDHDGATAATIDTVPQDDRIKLQQALVAAWKDTVGGYFKRFKPEHFFDFTSSEVHPQGADESTLSSTATRAHDNKDNNEALASLPAILTYAFLKADLDFVQAQARKLSDSTSASGFPSTSRPPKDDPVLDDRPLNDDDILSQPSLRRSSLQLDSRLTAPIGGGGGAGQSRFKGGSTCSITLVSTPTPTPFWHPASPSTMVVAHVGDTRILLCSVSDGKAIHLTSDHHPSTPVEATRLRRYASTFITDSFGEERVMGLANTRSFGDIASKAVGVSAEPEIVSIQLAPSQYSFMVIMSDGVSGVLSDQEIADIVKEARTPEQASKSVVDFATEVSGEADNATCMVVRLGGWERRSEGGFGSLGTKEMRDYKKQEAENPRARRS